LSAINECHEKNVSHQDIKPSNVLIDAYGRAKLADFGLSKNIDMMVKSSRFCGSLPYLAPEVVLKQKHDPFKADIWSLGITFYVMAFGKSPWNAKSEDNLLKQIMRGDVTYPDYPNELLVEFLKSILIINPDDRHSAQELLCHPIFRVNAKKKAMMNSRVNTELKKFARSQTQKVPYSANIFKSKSRRASEESIGKLPPLKPKHENKIVY